MRQPPHNIEAERAVLGGLLLDSSLIPEVEKLLKPGDFFRAAHETLFGEILGLYYAGSVVDAVTLADHLERQDLFQRIGGDDLLRALIDGTPHAVNTVNYALIVRAKSQSRKLIEVANQIARDAYEQRLAIDHLTEEAIEALRSTQLEPMCGGAKKLGSLIDAVWDRYERRSRGEVAGVFTGFHELDSFTDGFQPEQLIVLAGRPSMGKSAFAMNVCEHVSIDPNGIPPGSLFVSLEMGELSLAERVLASQARVDSTLLRTGKPFSDEDQAKIFRAAEKLRESPLYLIDRVASDYRSVVQVIREIHAKHAITLAIVDYLQLMTVSGSKANTTEQLDTITLAMKTVARECRIPLILLSQLNRGLESRTDKRPMMSDLRGSGAIEQHADLVLFLYRPHYYNPREPEAAAELIVGKNRTGPTGLVELAFIKKWTRFENANHWDTDPPLATFRQNTAF